MKRYLASFSERFSPLSPRNLLIFATIWLFTGFAVGTSVLMGPVRWVTDVARFYEASPDIESWAVRGIIVAYVGLTFVLSLYLARIFAATRAAHVRVLLLGLPILCAAGSLWLFLNPKLMGVHRGAEETISARFTFGPYPTEEKLAELKSRGFAGVISLLHPAVVPFEPKLLADETQAARAVGIRLIHIPLLPWVGGNQESLIRLREIAAGEDGPFYVHCYLGRDRVRVAANLLGSDYAYPDRPLESIRQLTRGQVIELGDGIFITPFPTQEEFLNYFLEAKQVVSLMDPSVEANREWLAREKEIVEHYQVPFLHMPLPLEPIDPELISSLVAKILTLARPVVIHDFLAPSPAIEAFIAASRGLPPLHYQRIENFERLPGAYFVNDTSVVGPPPLANDLGPLMSYGIDRLVFVGDRSSQPGIEVVFSVAHELGMVAEQQHPNAQLQPETETPRASYFFGPSIPIRSIFNRDFFGGQPIFTPSRGIAIIARPELNPASRETRELLFDNSYQRVVVVVDPQDPDEQRAVEQARKQFALHGIDVTLVEFARDPFDPERALQIASAIETMARPVVVLAASTEDPRAIGIFTAMQTSQPPAVPSLLELELRQGPVSAPSPHFAVGPRPTADEFTQELYRAGIRSFLLISDPTSAEALVDRTVASKANLDWIVLPPDSPKIFSTISQGGPWYVYGDQTIVDRLRSFVVGPPVPTTKLHYQTDLALESDAGEVSPPNWQEFLESATPTIRQIILGTPALLIYIFLAAAYASRLKLARNVRTPYTRKVFHFLIFTGACVLQLAFGLQAVVLFGSLTAAAVLYATWRGDGYGFYEALARPTDAPRRTLFIIIPLITTALGGVLANLLFGKFAVAGYLVGGWGDAVGEPVGSRFGKHKYRVPSLGGVPATRSLEGSAAVLVTSMLAAVLALYGLGYSWPVIAKTAAICALGSALVESISNHGLDNLTIQVTAAGICYALIA